MENQIKLLVNSTKVYCNTTENISGCLGNSNIKLAVSVHKKFIKLKLSVKMEIGTKFREIIFRLDDQNFIHYLVKIRT